MEAAAEKRGPGRPRKNTKVLPEGVAPAPAKLDVKPEEVKSEKVLNPQYKTIDIEMVTSNRIYGGLPQGKEQLVKWIESKGLIPEETLGDKLEVTPGLTPEQVQDKIELSSTVFRSDSEGLFMRDFMVKQMLKETATVLGLTTTKLGSKTVLTIGMVVEPERIRMFRDGNPIMEHDGFEEIQGKVGTPKGPRNILSRKAYLEAGIMIPFQICLLNTSKVNISDLTHLFAHAGRFVGFGSARSRESGKFKVAKFEVV